MSPNSFSISPIIHHRLKTLSLRDAQAWDVSSALLNSLTLPCLQELHTNEMVLLIDLPAFVHRSSCPLTRLTLLRDFEDELVFGDLRPLPGVTDLVVETLRKGCQADRIMKILLEEYFPDLRHLTLRLRPFLFLWDTGFIPLFLNRKRPQPNGPNEGKLHKFLVVERDKGPEFQHLWNLDVGEELRGLGITLREDGFEFL